MNNPYSVEIIVDIFLSLFLFICLCVNVYLRRYCEVTEQNIITHYNLVRVSYLLSFALCFLTGFIFKEKDWFFLPAILLVMVWFFVSNISFIVKQRGLYEEVKRKQKLSEDSILDQEI